MVLSRASISSGVRSWVGGSTETSLRCAGGPCWPMQELHPSSVELFSLWDWSSWSSCKPSQSTPYTSNSSPLSSSSGSWCPWTPCTTMSKPNISAGKWFGPSQVCNLCWFHASAKNESCWLTIGRKRCCSNHMWCTLLILRPCCNSSWVKKSAQ